MGDTEGQSLPPLSKIFFVYVNVSYHMLVCPFHLKYDPIADTLIAMRSSGFRKALLLSMWTVGELLMPIMLEPSKISNPESNLSSMQRVFEILDCSSWSVLNTIIKILLWRGHKKFGSMIRELENVERKLADSGIGIPRIFNNSVVLAVLLHILSLTFDLWEIESGTTRDIYGTALIVFDHEIIGPCRLASIIKNIGISFIEYESLLTAFCNSLMLITSATFFIVACSFRRHFEVGEPKGDNVAQTCKLLIRFSGTVKSSYGNIFCVVTLLLLPYYSRKIQDIFGGSLVLFMPYFYFIIRLNLVMWLAAAAHSHFDCLAQQLNVIGENRKNKHSGDIVGLRTKALILDALNRNGFGLKGSCFTVTYSFYGSIMISILAYSIAIVQLQCMQN